MKERLEQILYELLEHFDTAGEIPTLEVGPLYHGGPLVIASVSPELQETLERALEILDCDEREWEEDD